MPRYAPRVVVEISAVIQFGPNTKQVNSKFEADSVQIQRRSHSHAATCDVTVRGAALPFDPDLVAAASVIVFAGDAGEMIGGTWDGTSADRKRNIRFIGYADEFKREDGDRGPYVNIKARDVSMLFRAPEVLDAKAIPLYSDTLADALWRIVDSVLSKLSGHNGKTLNGSVLLRDTPALYDPPSNALTGPEFLLSKLVAGKHKDGPVTMPKAKASPWDAIEHVVGMCGRMVSMDQTWLTVRMPAEVVGESGVTDDQKPVVAFVFGAEDDALPDSERISVDGKEADVPANRNGVPVVPAMSVSRTRKLIRQRRGLSLTAYDTDTRRTITVVYPDDKHLPSRKLPSALTDSGAVQAANKQIAAKTKKKSAKAAKGGGSGKQTFDAAEDRDALYIRAGVHTEAQLLEIGKRIYEERSRYELEGTITTHEPLEEVLNLQNGDRITLYVSPNIEQALREKESEDEKVSYLEERLGVEREAAKTLLRATQYPRQTLFYVKGVNLSFYSDQPPSIEIAFINLLTVTV